MMPYRLLYSPITDWSVATFGLAAVSVAQTPDPSGVWSVTGMSSVVAVLLYLQYKREERLSAEQRERDQQAAAREHKLLERMNVIETTQSAKVDKASERLVEVIEKQAIVATKVNECLHDMSKVLIQLTDGQAKVQELLKTICTERPCLINADKDVLHEIMAKAKERGAE